MTTAVIGREEELGTIQAFLADVEHGPAALVLSGEAGIGKTVLWHTGVEEARARFDRVLTCRGIEAEASFAFAGLSDLVAGVVTEVTPALAPPRRRALEVALQLAEPGETAPDAHVIGLAVLDALRALAEHGPVLVALDDVQWLDPTSASVLLIALRRLSEEPVGLLATLRKAPEPSDPFDLERSIPPERLAQISVGPLTPGALHRLLEEQLGLELTRPELARVEEATAGNPFFALELGRELVRTNTRPTPGRTLPMPQNLRELLSGRLDRLPTYTGDVLLQAAALARPTVDLVAETYGDRERVLDALEAAVHQGVVELDDSRIRFSHPLLASICYEQAPIWKRQAVHRALAGAVSDLEERARHLALAAEGPDAVVADDLDAAAEHAAARGAPAAAAELCELAAELTPEDPALARQRRLRAATHHRLAGNTDRSGAILEQLLTEVPSGVERADILFGLAITWRAAVPRGLELCDEALANAAGDDARAARILALRGLLHLNEPNVQAYLADSRTALEKAERAGDPALLAAVIAHAGQAETWAAEVTPGLLERGAEIEERLGLMLEYTESPRVYLARLWMRLGEIERPRAMLEELEASASARGDEVTRAHLMWYLSLLEWLAGRWQRALELASTADEIAVSVARRWVGRVKGLVEADLGLVEEARASAEVGLAESRAASSEAFRILTLGVLGRLELALGDFEAAGGYLRDLPGWLLAGGMNDPTLPIWGDAIETLVTLGELEAAGAYLEQFELNARRLGSPLATEGVLRCRGLLCAAEGDVPAAAAAFERALTEQPQPPWPLERGRTLLCLGTVRRQAQQKKAAREALEQALAIFEELPAPLWAEKARAELKRISGRRAPSEDLTETERRVAELAAQGRTNKEIAAELFMGVSTVEAHLSRVYRKLGVRRSGLGSLLAKERDEAVQS